MGRRSRPGPLRGIVGTILDVLKDRAERRILRRWEGGPFVTLPALSYTGYPQVFERKRSIERLIRATERLEDRLDAIIVRVDGLESANKRLQLEWTETYDKVRHQLSRMARRGDLGKGKDPEEIVDEGADGASTVDPISEKIHARRNRPFLGRS